MLLHTPTEQRAALLDRMDSGRECTVLSLGEGEGFRSKMYQLGIHEGSRLTVVRNTGFGPLVVESGGTRLIMGRTMAGRIRIVRNNKSTGGGTHEETE